MSFQKVARFSDLAENKITAIQTIRVPIILIRKGDQVYAMENLCSHAEIPLDKGKLEREEIICPMHGAVFNIVTGAALKLPATEPVEVFETRIAGDDVEVKFD